MERLTNIISVGVDLHATQFTVCALHALTGEILLEEQYPTEAEGYGSFIEWAHEVEQKYEVAVTLAIEATGSARFFRNLMEKEGFMVIVINTLKFKVIVQSAKKTDKHDAFTIATFLCKDMLPESYLCDQETEELRKLISQRADLVSMVVKTKNKIHALLRGFGIKTESSQFQSEKKRQQILREFQNHTLFTEHAAKTLKMFLDNLTVLAEQVKLVEELIDEFTEGDEVVEILETIPGVGKITSSTIRSYVGDIGRFETYKQFAAYCGLTPLVRFSNEHGFTGHITKGGPKELRTAMVQMVMGMLRMQKRLGAMSLLIDYKRMKREKGSGKSIVAFARKLSRVVYVMLKTGQPFNLEKLTLASEKHAS